jgi:hypothetical protein
MPPPGLLKRLPGDCHRHPYSTGVDTAVLALTTPRREPLRFVARAASPQCVIEQRFDRLAFGRVNSAVERVASGARSAARTWASAEADPAHRLF